MNRNRLTFLISGFLILLIGFVTFGPRMSQMFSTLRQYLAMPVYDGAIVSNGKTENIVFLHHSTGRNLIAEGDVRLLFKERNYQFWDHDYNYIGLTDSNGTRVNAHYKIPGRLWYGDTDVNGLVALFSQPVNYPPDNAFSRLMQHDVIIVKSCFPNSAIEDEDKQRQMRESYLQIRDMIDKHPEHLFIIFTSPPLHPLATNMEEAAQARLMANWLTSDDFLENHPNLFVFDFFDLLADSEAGTLRSEYQISALKPDSHPNRLANEEIGPLFVDFVDRAVQTYRAG